MAQKQTITQEMTIGDILSNYPQHSQKLAHTMTLAGLHCSSCSAATWETLEAGVLGHGMSRGSLEALVKKLNEIIQEEVSLETISMTKKAAEKFSEIATEEGKPGAALRFGQMAGGCSGFEYLLDFSTAAEADDATFESHGVQIHVKKGMVGKLLGCVIDFVDGLHDAGFKISNPNVKSSCGCGKSQGY